MTVQPETHAFRGMARAWPAPLVIDPPVPTGPMDLGEAEPDVAPLYAPEPFWEPVQPDFLECLLPKERAPDCRFNCPPETPCRACALKPGPARAGWEAWWPEAPGTYVRPSVIYEKGAIRSVRESDLPTDLVEFDPDIHIPLKWAAMAAAAEQSESGGPGFTTTSLRDLLAESDEPPKQLGRGVPKVGVVVLAGPPKVGKSALVMQFALTVGSALPTDTRPQFLGQPVDGGTVLYVVEEGARAGLRWRAAHQAAGLGIEDAAIEFLYRERIRLDDEQSVAALRDTVRRIKPALVVIDPLNRAHGRNEDRATEMTPVMDALSGIAYDFGTSVVVIHHVNKPSDGRNGQDRQRGSTAIRSGSDANLILDQRDGVLNLIGEYRDFPDVSEFVTFDPETLLFTTTDAPLPRENSRRKIAMPDLLEYVQGQGQVRASAVAERFDVSVNTAKTALNEAVVRQQLDAADAGRTRMYFIPRA